MPDNKKSDLNRRRFLSTSAKLVAGATAAANLPKELLATESEPVPPTGSVSQETRNSRTVVAAVIDPGPLEANGVDVAGVVTEEFLNRFAKAHFDQGNDIYKGEYVVDDFDSKLKISYEFKHEIKFELSPIKASLFKNVWVSHLRAKGATKLTDVALVPPNLVIRSEGVKFVFTVYKGHTNDEDYSVDFEWDLEARCAVTLVDAEGGTKAVRLEPLKVKFSKPPETIAKEIADAIKKLAATRARAKTAIQGRFGDPTDPEWCVKLEKLFLFLVNQVLALSMTNFIQQWNLPKAIDLVKGVAIAPTYLEIASKSLIVGGQVLYSLPRISPMSERVTAFLEEFNEQFATELASLTDAQAENWKPETSPSFRFLQLKKEQIQSEYKATLAKAATAVFAENVQILSNKKLFDALAKAYLKDEHHGDYSHGIDFIVKAEAGWWEKVDGGYGDIVPGGVKIGANVQVGGYARACVPNLDPKHWGEWMCIGLCVQLEPKPDFGMRAYPTFPDDGIHLRLILLTERIEAKLCGDVPDWVNKIIGWITGVLTEPLLDVIRAFIALFNFKIVDYPKYFPGTPLEWRPRFNERPVNVGSYLAFTADPEFK